MVQAPARPALSPPIRTLELFCGIGGFAAAAAGSGVEVVRAVDINTLALEVYRQNFDHPTEARVVESLSADALARLEADLWWMSPPCQPFTRRGKALDDQDPRSKGFLTLLDRLADLRPRALALENVPEFAGSRTHARLLAVLERADYEVAERMICPTELGIPNRRKRYYLAASRTGLHPWTPSTAVRMPLATYLEANEAGGSLDVAPDGGRAARRRLAATRGLYLGALPEGAKRGPTAGPSRLEDPAGLAVPDSLLRRYQHALDVVDAGDPDAVTACFTAAYGHSPVRSGSYLRTPTGPRYFSPDEILRLLGFPKGFRWPEGLLLANRWRLAGNSLSVPVVRAVLEALLPSPA